MRKGNTGKRFLTAVAIASLSLILAACAGGESGQEPSLESSAAAAEAEESAEIKDEDRKSTRLNSSHITRSRMPSSA